MDQYKAKLEQYALDISEKRTELINNSDQIIHKVGTCLLSFTPNQSPADREYVLKNCAKAMALFSEINYSMLYFLEKVLFVKTFDKFDVGTLNLVDNAVQEDKISNTSEVKNSVHLTNDLSELNPEAPEFKISRSEVANDSVYSESDLTGDNNSFNKVSWWLMKNGKKDSSSEVEGDATIVPVESSAIQKLTVIKRQEEISKKKLDNSLPVSNLKLVPVKQSACIENSPSKNKKPKKNKNRNNDTVVALKKMNIPKKGSIVMFSHVESPSEFYLQVVSDEDVSPLCIDSLAHTLRETWNGTTSKYKTKQTASLDLGNYFCGYISKKNGWYRLQVLNWQLDSSSNDVDVFAIDYGFKCTISYKYLRPLTEELQSFPILAFKCHLALLYPPGSTSSNRLTEWPEVSIDALRNLAIGSDIQLYEVIFIDVQDDSLAVDLVENNNHESLAEILIKLQLAFEIGEEEIHENNTDLEEFLERDKEIESARNLNELVWGYDPKDESRICKFSRPDGTCYKKENCKLKHIILKDGYTTDKALAFYTAANELQPPYNGEVHQCLVTACINPTTYIVQIIRNPVKSERLTLTLDKDVNDIIELLNNPKIMRNFKPFHICMPPVGELVIAYYAPLASWLRARVVDSETINNKVFIKMYSVDFGKEFSVQLKDIREMMEDFIKIPFQGLRVYLANYENNENCDLEKVMEFFQTHIASKVFLVYFLSDDAPYSVSIKTLKGNDIGPILLKEGFVVQKIFNINVNNSLLLLE